MPQRLCPKCREKLPSDQNVAGEVVVCPNCKGRFRFTKAQAPAQLGVKPTAQPRPRPQDDTPLSPSRPRAHRADDDDDEAFEAQRPRKKSKRKSRGLANLSWLGFNALTVLLGLGIITIPCLVLGFIWREVLTIPYTLSLLVAGVAYIWFLVIAFQDSAANGLACLFVPFFSLYYAIANFSEVKQPFLIFVACVLFPIPLVLIALVFFAASGRLPQGPPVAGAPNAGFQEIRAAGAEPGSAEHGLRAYWSFNEGKGIKAKDSGPQKLEATLHGCQWVPGVNGTALQLNGTSDYVDLGPATSLTFADKAPFTIAAWVKTTKARGLILSFRKEPDDTFDLLNIFLKGGSLAVWVRPSGDPLNPEQADSKVRINDGKWHHFAVTRTAEGEVGLYLDGTLQSRIKAGGGRRALNGRVVTNLHSLGVEARNMGGKQAPFVDPAKLEGCIDELSIWGEVLSDQVIQKSAGR